MATCGSDCFRYNAAITEISLPVLATCGSDCFSSNAAITEISLPLLATCGSYCFRYNAAITQVKIKGHKLTIKNVDGSAFVTEAEKTSKGIKIYTGYNLLSVTKKVIEKDPCFVAEKDGFYAHGETVKQAISDLQFKIVAEKIKKDPIHADTMITPMYYRIVTGACEFGTKAWLEQNKLTGVEKMRADELVKLLKKTNAYGFERFQSLLAF